MIRILLKKGKYFRKWYLSQHEIYRTLPLNREWWIGAPCWDKPVKLEKHRIRSMEIFSNKISELCKGAKRPQYNFNLMNKIGRRSNAAHPPTTIAISHFWFILFCFFSIVYGSYGQRWLRRNTNLIWMEEHYIFIKFCLYLFYSFLG